MIKIRRFARLFGWTDGQTDGPTEMVNQYRAVSVLTRDKKRQDRSKSRHGCPSH